MSKLIVEMEMPQNCKKCPLVHTDHFGQIRCGGQSGRLIHLKNFQTEIERPSWCPIVGVLPDEHGDLIDRDALLEKYNKKGVNIAECLTDERTANAFEKYCIIADAVEAAETVIAAERKEDEQD